MRYYNIELSGTSTIAGAPATTGPTIWTSFPNGVVDPNALNVEFDFFSFEQQEGQGGSTLTIYGLSLDTLQQANAGAYTGMTMTVKAGMQKGLPLAVPSQAGTILQGKIYQSFGNWVSTDMTLDFVLLSADYTYQKPGNFVLNWPKGTSLKDALATCLNVAFPTFGNFNVRTGSSAVQLLIGDEYVLSYDAYHACNTLANLSEYITSITRSIKPPGVRLSYQASTNSILAYDGSIALGAPIQINFTDLIGQPTWIDQNVMQFTTVMRGDITVNSVVSMPQGLTEGPGTVILTGSSLPSSLKYETSFQGPFTITGIRYIGNFRDASGLSWISVFRCVPKTPAKAA